jgi:hypothetical protein
VKTALLLIAVVMVSSCSGGGDSGAPTASPDVSAAPTTDLLMPEVTDDVPPLTQLSPEAHEELGALEQPVTGGESTGPLGQTVLELDTGDGSVQIGEGEVPASMAELPVPDDLLVELSSSTDDAAGFSGVSEQSVEDLAKFYREELASAGFRLVSDDTPAASITVLSFEGESGSGGVALSEAPRGAGTTVIMTFSPLG